MYMRTTYVIVIPITRLVSISCQLKQRRVSGPKVQSMSVYCVYYVHYVHCVHAYVHASIYGITKIAYGYHVTRTSVRLLSRSLGFISSYKIAARGINYMHFHEISCEKSTSLGIFIVLIAYYEQKWAFNAQFLFSGKN